MENLPGILEARERVGKKAAQNNAGADKFELQIGQLIENYDAGVGGKPWFFISATLGVAQGGTLMGYPELMRWRERSRNAARGGWSAAGGRRSA